MLVQKIEIPAQTEAEVVIPAETYYSAEIIALPQTELRALSAVEEMFAYYGADAA